MRATKALTTSFLVLALLAATGSAAASSYDLENATLENTYNVSIAHGPQDVEFRENGSKMFLLTGTWNESIRQYSLSTPYIANTSTLEKSYNLTGVVDSPQGLEIEDTGSKFYVSGHQNITTFDASNAYDVSTLSETAQRPVVNTSRIGSANELFIRQNGTKLVVSTNGINMAQIVTFDLSTTYDLGTATADQRLNLTDTTYGGAMEISEDGESIYMAQRPLNISKFSMSNPLDIESSTFTENVATFSNASETYGIEFTDGGTKLYSTSGPDGVIQRLYTGFIEETMTGNATDWNIIELRNAPEDQSFEYLANSDTENMTYNDSTAIANGSALYETRNVRADYFDRLEIDMEASAGTLKVVNATENETVLVSEQLEIGSNTVNLSSLETSKVRLKFELDDKATITSLKVYGDRYSDGLFGGGNLITGNFFGNIPVVGEFLSGLTAGVNNLISGILSIPSQIFEGIMEVIPFL